LNYGERTLFPRLITRLQMKSNNPKSIAILGATFETPNLGVSALAAGAVRCLHKRFPDADLFFLDYEPPVVRPVVEEDTVLEVPLVQMRFSKRFWLSNNIVVLLLLAALYRLCLFKGLRAALTRRNSTFEKICNADLFTAVSGGDSFADLYGLPRFLYVCLPQILALLLGKPLVQLPQTYGPFKGTLARSIARFIVHHSACAFCRDFSSLNKLYGTSPSSARRSNAAFCYDMAFGIDSIAPQNLDVDGIDLTAPRERSLIGLNISGLLYREAGSSQSAFGIRSNYRATMLAAIDYFIAEENTTVLLVPHVFGYEANSESDLEASKEVFAELQNRYAGRIGLACGSYGPNEIRYLIGQCDFFTGSRMHACIAAWSQCIPAVAIAYSDKFLGVLETIGVESLAADARSLSQEQILAILRNAYRGRKGMHNRLNAVIPEVRSAVHHLLFDPSGSTVRGLEKEGAGVPVAVR
jgi:colanic acid/amylovoran biosynthesis protein WcaK/AmsJ